MRNYEQKWEGKGDFKWSNHFDMFLIQVSERGRLLNIRRLKIPPIIVGEKCGGVKELDYEKIVK